jgi:hypothetical protein
MIDNCLLYLKRGWSVVPVPHGMKHPDMDWKVYQGRRASEAEALSWWRDKETGRQGEEEIGSQGDSSSAPPLLTSKSAPGMAVICGAVSGNLVCLDFDDLSAYDQWAALNPEAAKELPTAKSARGMHVFFRTEKPERSGKFCIAGTGERVPGTGGTPKPEKHNCTNDLVIPSENRPEHPNSQSVLSREAEGPHPLGSSNLVRCFDSAA